MEALSDVTSGLDKDMGHAIINNRKHLHMLLVAIDTKRSGARPSPIPRRHIYRTRVAPGQ